jgi:hypothetical protein
VDIRQQLLKINSRANADLVENHVIQDRRKLVELVACFFSDETKVVQRASQVVGNLGRSRPSWLEPWWEELLAAGNRPVHVAVRRNVARYFSELDLTIPVELERKLAKSFADWIAEPNVPVAVAVFAMQFIADRADRYPSEAHLVIKTIRARIKTASPGFKNRATRILRQLGDDARGWE